MIKLEYRPWKPDSEFDSMVGPPTVEQVTMTLGDDVSWDEAVCEFRNFLRAAGYVIPYDFEKEGDYVDCSDPPDMDKSGSLWDRQPEWAMSMSEDEFQELREALEEAVYLLNPTDEDMQKKAGVYRVVTALEKLKEKNT